MPPAQPVPPVPTPNEPPGSAITPPGAAPQAAGTPANTVGAPAGGGQIILSPPGTDFRVGGGPYTVPVSITGASQVSSVTLTITFNPAALRVRAVQEGSFMRSGGVHATFTQQVDAAGGPNRHRHRARWRCDGRGGHRVCSARSCSMRSAAARRTWR